MKYLLRWFMWLVVCAGITAITAITIIIYLLSILWHFDLSWKRLDTDTKNPIDFWKSFYDFIKKADK